MRRVITKNPDAPITRSYYREHGNYSDSCWEGEFGTFANFRRAAGLDGISQAVDPQETEKKAMSEDPTRTDDIKDNEWVVSLPKTNIHTLEQLVRFCKVDLEVWEVDRFVCNKWEVVAKIKKDGTETMEREPLYQVKAWFKRKVVQQFILQEIELLKERAAKFSPKVPHIVRPSSTRKSGIVVEHGLYDHHFGAHIWGKETGSADWDLPTAKKYGEEAIATLLDRTDSFRPDSAVYVVGNDLVNADNRAGTTEHLTPQSMDSRYQKVYGVARDFTVWAIDQMVARYGKVHVPVVGGNHDPLACWHLGDYLSAWYHNNPNVTIDNSPAFRKWWEYGANMIMFCHGNKGKLEDYGKTMASDQPEMWGRTKWREAHTGDKHQRRLIEFSGYSVRILPTLRPPCGWSAENMYSSMRAAESYVWSHDEGLVGQASYNVLPGA
jgi:hypothetical protein